jgi:hypothetical protein
VAERKVEGSQPITVSITGSSGQFTGTNTIGTGADLASHGWFTTTQQTGYVYSANGKAPKLFVTLINPSLTEKVNDVKVTLRIRGASSGRAGRPGTYLSLSGDAARHPWHPSGAQARHIDRDHRAHWFG